MMDWGEVRNGSPLAAPSLGGWRFIPVFCGLHVWRFRPRLVTWGLLETLSVWPRSGVETFFSYIQDNLNEEQDISTINSIVIWLRWKKMITLVFSSDEDNNYDVATEQRWWYSYLTEFIALLVSSAWSCSQYRCYQLTEMMTLVI